MKFTRRDGIKGLSALALYKSSGTQCLAYGKSLTNESTESLWNRTVSPFMADDQWTDDYSYDAGNALMVPLHAAFANGADPIWQQEFASHAERFQLHLTAGGTLPENRLNRLQFLYVWSQFALLSAARDVRDMVPSGLIERIVQEHAAIWSQIPAWQWGQVTFPGGIRERLAWKRSLGETEPSYYRAIIDEEFFSFAIAADLVALDVAQQDAFEAVTVADAVFSERSFSLEDGGWLFDPGVWEDHPDYLYAGNPTIEPSMEQKPIRGIAGDTSHAHRMARWMKSLEGVPRDAERSSPYADALNRLNVQFTRKVLVPPSEDFAAYRTTNYLDGNNGVYRWEYATQGRDKGYGPYELSGTLSLGWWTFLDSDESRELYRSMAASFPLPQDVIDLYVGPNTSRHRHHLMELPGFYHNGFAELIARLARELRPIV